MNSARVAGPALAGVLIVTIGTTPCFAVNTVSYVAVIAALVILRPLRPGVRGRRAAGGVHAGLHYAASRQPPWLPLVMMALVGLLAFNFPVILLLSESRDTSTACAQASKDGGTAPGAGLACRHRVRTRLR